MDRYFPTVPGVDITKLKINEEGKYSVTKPETSLFILNYIFKKVKEDKITVLDGTGNVGGDTIGFGLSDKVKKVTTTEINTNNLELLENNVKVYHLEDKVTLHHADFTKYIKTLKKDFCDLIFVDPPWGGPKYKFQAKLSLYLSKINIGIIAKQIKINKIAKYFVLKVPFNFNITSFQNISTFDDISIYNVPGSSIFLLFCEV